VDAFESLILDVDPRILIALVVSAVASAVSTPLVGRMAIALRVVDVPSPRKVNTRPNIPLLGGVAVAIGCASGLVAAWWMGVSTPDDNRRLVGFFLGGAILLALGAWDDRFGLDAKVKLVFQIIAASVAFQFGFRFDYLTLPWAEPTYSLPTELALAVTLLWIVAVTNAMNLMDGLDGLATGVGAIIAATLIFICWPDQYLGVLLGVALLGAQLGFLPFNFPPGRIFLGDSGAYFIGYAIAVVGLSGYQKPALFAFALPLMALAVPFLDTLLSVLRRFRGRQRIMGADGMHLHHRLLQVAGGSQRDTVLSLYFLTACYCLIAAALAVFPWPWYWGFALLLVVIALTIRLLRNLGLLEDTAEVSPGQSKHAQGEDL
jgi:UDP-GlcNAc:undecaprenyl-phosphate GlcNAc-1-phosphate transferase